MMPVYEAVCDYTTMTAKLHFMTYIASRVALRLSGIEYKKARLKLKRVEEFAANNIRAEEEATKLADEMIKRMTLAELFGKDVGAETVEEAAAKMAAHMKKGSG